MKIEEGKFYRNRLGEKIGPMKPVNGVTSYAWFCKRNAGPFYTTSYYTDEGFYDVAMADEEDLIEEWEEPAALPPATEADEGWGPWNEGKLLFPTCQRSSRPTKNDYREECINGVWRWQSRPHKPVEELIEIYVAGSQNPREEHTHKISYKKVNGVVDCSSVKMEPL